jgi:hypothetical protein
MALHLFNWRWKYIQFPKGRADFGILDGGQVHKLINCNFINNPSDFHRNYVPEFWIFYTWKIKLLLSLCRAPQLLQVPANAGFLCVKAAVFGTAIKQTHFTFQSFGWCQSTSGFLIHCEGGICHTRRNVRVASTHDVPKPQKAKVMPLDLTWFKIPAKILVTEEGVTKTFMCARTLIGQHVFLQLVGVEGSLSVCEVEVFTTNGKKRGRNILVQGWPCTHILRSASFENWNRTSMVLRLSWFYRVPPRKCGDSALKLGHNHFFQNPSITRQWFYHRPT